MKKQTVVAVLLIFFFTVALLYAGLNVSESGLRQLSGNTGNPSAFVLVRDDDGVWQLTFGGRTVRLSEELLQTFR